MTSFIGNYIEYRGVKVERQFFENEKQLLDEKLDKLLGKKITKNGEKNVEKYNQYFEQKNRPNGDKYIACRSDTPTELRDLIRAIHFNCFGGCLPNDWIYDVIDSALSDLEDNQNNLDRITIEPDCYTLDLIEWTKEPYAIEMIEEAREEMGCVARFEEGIAWGQIRAKQVIYDEVHEFLKNLQEEEQEEEQE